LPKENIGKNRDILKKDLMSRLVNLDPEKTFFQKYRLIVKDKINKSVNIDKLDKWKNHILTITFTIGGAGAQSDIGLRIMKSLRQKILDGTARLNIAVGTKLDLKMEFEKYAADLGLKEQMGRGFNIIFALDKKTYFETFNYALRTTDVLWTKPSEMSFYTALGIPIIIAPPIGAHEHYNKTWLEHIGSGFVQENPDYIHEWLFYWLKDGRIADAALQGFIDANNMGTYNIESYIFNDKFKNK
jgi:UDP-N-acetylglucosamine:LPS N-acetylglucosamine transferase